MGTPDLLFAIFLIFAGAAVLATLALAARQAMILAYIAMGALAGPAGFGLVESRELIASIAEIGIMFLLYLLGLNLYPQKLLQMLRQATLLTIASSLIFFAVGFVVVRLLGFGTAESLIVGAAMMFSSTILGLKLLPTTALHHRHAGEIIISVLLLQDIIAILVLLFIQSGGRDPLPALITMGVALPGVIVVAWALERFVLQRLLVAFDQIQEYVFLLAIGWCLGIAQLAHSVGLSYEIGAFIAGVSLATSPIARFIAESLRPIRDFFLVIFFFTLGAGLDPAAVRDVLLPAAVLATAMLVLKPAVFHQLLMRQGERPELSREMGVRLGQISEFSLLIAVLAPTTGAISARAGLLIQIATLLSFVVSSYWIVARFPTPMAVDPALRRD